jgi:spermidine/putrescine-binding protein
MSLGKRFSIAMLCISASLTIGCDRPHSSAPNARAGESNDDSKVVNLCIWADYMAPDTMASFEKQTGVKVRIAYFDNPETLESRMLTGSSGFDVVVPTSVFVQRQIRSGAYLSIDKSKLPNLTHLDPAIMGQVAFNDPGNAHGVAYLWGTAGIGYNERMLAQALPNAPRDSSRLFFDPAVASKLAKCGINIMDDPVGAVRTVLKYLRRRILPT